MRIPKPLDVIQHNEHKVSLRLAVADDLIYFPGHFPSRLVLPGVVMVDWAVSFAEQYLPIRIEFSALETIKFKQVVLPPQEINLHLEYKPKHGKLYYRVDSTQGEHSSGKISQAKEVSND